MKRHYFLIMAVIATLAPVNFGMRLMRNLIAPILLVIVLVIAFSTLIKSGLTKISIMVVCIALLLVTLRAFRWARTHITKIEKRDNHIIVSYDDYGRIKSASINLHALVIGIEKAFGKGDVSKLVICDQEKAIRIVQYELFGWTRKLMLRTYDELRVLQGSRADRGRQTSTTDGVD